MWIPIPHTYKVWTLLHDEVERHVEKSVLDLNMSPQIHKRIQLCHYASTDCLCHWCVWSWTGYFILFPHPLPLLLFCWLSLSIGISLCNLSPNGNCVRNYVSVCCFEVTVWNTDDSDIRVLAWCRAQKLYFYFIITDHNTMQVLCIFYCLSNIKLLVCTSSRGIGRLLILPVM